MRSTGISRGGRNRGIARRSERREERRLRRRRERPQTPTTIDVREQLRRALGLTGETVTAVCSQPTNQPTEYLMLQSDSPTMLIVAAARLQREAGPAQDMLKRLERVGYAETVKVKVVSPETFSAMYSAPYTCKYFVLIGEGNPPEG